MNKEKLITKNTCKHCGHRGFDVGIEMVYIGGRGYVPIMVCNDGVACWQKWSNKKQDNLWLGIDRVLNETIDIYLANDGCSTTHFTNQIQDLIKEAGYVQLDENQELPDTYCGDYDDDIGNYAYRDGQDEAQVNMIQAGFRRVKGSSLCKSKLNKRGGSKTSPPEGEL